MLKADGGRAARALVQDPNERDDAPQVTTEMSVTRPGSACQAIPRFVLDESLSGLRT
jgi:hypothetical protein